MSANPARAHASRDLVVVQRITAALNAASTYADIGGVVSAEIATVLGATRSVLVVEHQLVELRGVTTPDDAIALAGALHSMPARWIASETAPVDLAWFGGVTIGVFPLTSGDTRVGTLVLGLDSSLEVAPRELAEDLAAVLAVAVTRTRPYELMVRRYAEKDQFLSQLGHELRNPLSPIMTAAQLMRLRAPDMLVKERSTIERSVATLIRIVDEVLDLSRLSRGGVELSRSAIELADVVTQALDTAKAAVDERAHRVTVSVPHELKVNADRSRLAQAIANVIGNAARFTRNGGHIQIHAEHDGDQVTLEVIDNGSGIDAALLPRVFEPFVQGTERKGGLGVGLAVTRTLVELHSGRVSASSSGPGQGTRVTFTLPIWQAAQAAATPAAPARAATSEPPEDRRRILVVDDNEDAAWLLAEALRMLGHEVRVSHDGMSALELAQRWSPEIAFLDIGLPGMDGFALCSHLVKLPMRPHVIAVTGYGQPNDRERAIDAGFDAHFVKPVSLRDVQSAITAFTHQN
ncbi:MAG: ATP-binding protein [Myxococcota bacterium]|nr:ATP-binding protein [Myxococcota bacterium]